MLKHYVSATQIPDFMSRYVKGVMYGRSSGGVV